MAKILIVEDDRVLSEALAYNLRREDHSPITVGDAQSAIEAARRERPELIILDLMLPGGNGLDVCKAIRDFSTAPIIILTARDDDFDRVLGLEVGADDYVTKPFSLRELLARIKANLRRVNLDQRGPTVQRLQTGNVTLDLPRRSVTVDGQTLALQPKEFDLIAHLMQHPGQVHTRDQLLFAVWGHDYVGERTVDVHVRRVRAKLESAGGPNLIRTIHGVGYAFEGETIAGSD